ncbi:MAG TPA: S-methyl-5'-thioadenosine phosphorylase [Anaeromyxobacteraceae bacterium]|nr:S-methyl-5'-thioadenosine phosphorylase [Anaeromyxobacteraceae bacterium]
MLGIIGGSGLEHAMGALGRSESHDVDTPFGKPSAPIVTTEVDGVPLALLKRHGEGHAYSPSNIPFRANVFAMKKLGVTRILGTGAVGSLKEEIAPRSLCIPDQVIDKTFRRAGSFFDDIVVHVELASPFCPTLREVLARVSQGFPGTVHQGGTYVCMEGPQFSTRAESDLHRSWGASLIGMTVMPEARLAREAEICYALVALPTDYDCWRPHPHALDQFELLQEIIGNLKAASQTALQLIRETVPHVRDLGARTCPCQSSLELAIWTDRAAIPAATRERLRPILGKYLDAKP